MTKKTIGSVLAESNGVGRGFDFLRLALATGVVLNHSFFTVNGNFDFVYKYKLWAFFGAILPMFYCLSGFLIVASAQRLKLKDFLINRGMRILPALMVDICVSAFIIGPIFTTVPLHQYFTDKEFSHYFLNLMGFVHFYLPGVFLNHPLAGQVNGSLWTIPYEIGCYAIMSAMIVFGIMKSKRKMIYSALGFTAFYFAMSFMFQNISPFTSGSAVENYLNNFITRGAYLYFYFLSGAVFYVLKDHIPYNRTLAIISALIIMIDGVWIWQLGTLEPILLFFPVGYLTCYIGLKPIKKVPFYSGGDYSYGIYLYGFPFQQMLIAMFPKISVAANFVGAMILITGVAYISWHFIEKPILRIRKKYSFTAHKGDAVEALPVPTPEMPSEASPQQSTAYPAAVLNAN